MKDDGALEPGQRSLGGPIGVPVVDHDRKAELVCELELGGEERALQVMRRVVAVEVEPRLADGYSALVPEQQTSYHVCTGVGPDLMESARDAVRAGIRHLEERRGLEREEAYALCSVAADLHIHEVVDAPNWVVGLFLPDNIFQEHLSG